MHRTIYCEATLPAIFGSPRFSVLQRMDAYVCHPIRFAVQSLGGPLDLHSTFGGNRSLIQICGTPNLTNTLASHNESPMHDLGCKKTTQHQS